MLRNFSMLVFLSWILLLGPCTLVMGKPYEAYPIDEQYPPVARVVEAFSFQISNDTFKSSVSRDSQISYSATNLPQWLSFDSSARTFYGTPDSNTLKDGAETLYFDITLQGTDPADNEGFSKSYQLVVTDQSSIKIADNFNLLALLKNYGSTNGKDGLILTPNEIFNVTFDRSTFTSDQPIVAYYGQSLENNAPLPSWLTFDPNNLEFSGTAPVVNSNIAPQISFGFVLTATDIKGFSGISVPFHLVIGAHELTTSIQNSMIINVTSSGDFSYKLPLNYVYLDENPIQTKDLGAIQLVGAPSWVKLSNDTLSGTMPMDNPSSNSTSFSVAVHDIYDDVIYLNFMIESTDKLFAVSTLSNLNATRGEWFQYNFLPSQFTDYSQTTVSVNYTNSTQSHDWISFESSNMTLHGQVPHDFERLAMKLIASRGSQTQGLDFQIIGMNDRFNHTNHTSTLTSSSSSSSSTSLPSSSTSLASSTTTDAAPTATVSSTPPVKKKSNKTTAIACGVAIPLGLIALIAILLLVFWRRRNNRKNSSDDEKGPNISGPDLNNPANRPNQQSIVPVDPFGDDQSSDTSGAKRLAALNAMKLDQSSFYDSDVSTVDEKGNSVASEDLHHDTRSTDNLLKPDTVFFDPQNRSSSVYIDSEPANRKSWRYKLSSPLRINEGGRDSCISTSTVSTVDLLNTVIKDGQNINKDPRKSTLGMRDSVFCNDNSKSHSSNSVSSRSAMKFTPENDVLPILDEHSNPSPNYKSATSPSSSSSDDFVPVKDGQNYNWIHRAKPDRRPSNKRLVQTENQSKVDVGQVAEIEGHFPEKI
ncbi:hypothetical protein HG537_0B02650 [Torulaspora globosa]|uniref:Dystroglycan-type cadherin-like domain-containing protein n=1 Tax=Torulaspora globosa TaxID=48254 RepID=A0A7H9HQK0_9SACH|nr:hypothetical protein HG537_0B02650 [Torulaspora sp. CBS 2947]